jgi:hypothetical protein
LDEAVGALVAYMPGVQVAHGAHEEAFVVVEKVPLVQDAQVRSLIVVPSLAT